jgi:tetratricopeptide (TPR) repeat protein
MKRTSVIGLAVLGWAMLLPGCRPPTPEELVASGVSEYQLGRLDRAKGLLERALQGSPSDPDALFYMGRIYHADKLYVQAIYYYECCFDAHPGYPEVSKYLSQARREAGTAGQPSGSAPGLSE